MHKNPIRYLKQLVAKAAWLLRRQGEADTPAVDGAALRALCRCSSTPAWPLLHR